MPKKEDAIITLLDQDSKFCIFGVLDGHGGKLNKINLRTSYFKLCCL